MSNGFERSVPSESPAEHEQTRAENPKEVKKVNKDFALFKALIDFRDLQKMGLSDNDAIDQVMREHDLNRVDFTDYLEELKGAKESIAQEAHRQHPQRKDAPKRKYHTEEQVRRYQESRPDLFN